MKNLGIWLASCAAALLIATPAFAAVASIQSIKVTGPNQVTVTFSEPVTANIGSFGNLVGGLAGRNVFSLTGSGTATLILTLDGAAITTTNSDYLTIAPNLIFSVSNNAPFPGGTFQVQDGQPPVLSSITIASSNTAAGIGTSGNTVMLTFWLNKSVNSTSATINNQTVGVSGAANGPYTASYSYSGTLTGSIPVSLSFTDATGNVGRASMTVSSGAVAANLNSGATIISSATTPGKLRIGDSITFTILPTSIMQNARVTGSYNGVPLAWGTNNNGATYTATYVVSNGNTDQSSPLQITGVVLTDSNGTTNIPLSGSDVQKTIDAHAPSLYEASALPATTSNAAGLRYSFVSSEVGTIRYSGDCSSPTTSAVAGSNAIVFNPVSVGAHTNCTITVTDAAGNMSAPLMVSSFTTTDGAAVSTPSVSSTSSSDLQAKLDALKQQLAAQQASAYHFTLPLKLGSTGNEVRELQKRLTEGGYYAGAVTGTFGAQTKAAVQKYQKAHGLEALGSVGPGTRAALNSE